MQPKMPWACPCRCGQAVGVILTTDSLCRRKAKNGVHLAADTSVVHRPPRGLLGLSSRSVGFIRFSVSRGYRENACKARRSTNALTVETKVKEMTSSPVVYQQERRHFQRVRAGGVAQDFLRPNELFKRGTAAPGKVAVAEMWPLLIAVAHILELIPRKGGC